MNVVVPSHVVVALSWWQDLRSVCGGLPFSSLSLTKTLIMDTSGTDWRAHLDHLQIQGPCPQGTGAPHQCLGAQSHQASLHGLPICYSKLHSADPDGQLLHNTLHEQARMLMLISPLPGSHQTLNMVPPTQDNPDGSSPPGFQQPGELSVWAESYHS